MNLNSEEDNGVSILDTSDITLDSISNQHITIRDQSSPAPDQNITIHHDESHFSSFHGGSGSNDSGSYESPSLEIACQNQNMTIEPQYLINVDPEHDLLFRKAGIELFSLIRSIPSETKRRHLMAILCGEENWITRNQISSILQKRVHDREYSAARKHNKFPGAGMPIILKKHFQKRIKDDTMAEFMEWLHAAGYLQNLAYGHKNVKLCNGVHIAIESVKRTKNIRSIVRLYSDNWVEEGLASQKRDTLVCRSERGDMTVARHNASNHALSYLESDVADTDEDNSRRGFHISGVESIEKNDSLINIGDKSGSGHFDSSASKSIEKDDSLISIGDKSGSSHSDSNASKSDDSTSSDENGETEGNVEEECCLENWCPKKNPKTRTFCLKEKEHTGKCQFTPKGKLSPSSIERVLSQLTSGDLKSLRGLDNIDVEKGYENFERLKAIVSSLLDTGNFGHGDCPEASKIFEDIEESQEFHKIDFPRHLGQGESKLIKFYFTIICAFSLKLCHRFFFS